MGEMLAPKVWCREKWCREGQDREHRLGDGCSCDPHGKDVTGEPRKITLTASAARLAAFACRACGRKTRDMVEYPDLLFRCEPCADADRWPVFRSRNAGPRF